MGDYYETFEPPFYPESPAQRAKLATHYGRTDEEIVAELRERLSHLPPLDVEHVDVAVTDRLVTLKGTTRSRDMAEFLRRIAENAAGVRGVRNELVIHL